MNSARVGVMAFGLGVLVSLVGAGCKKKGDASADASADAAAEASAAIEDASVAPLAVEDAAVEAAAPVATVAKTAAPAAIVGLPKSCVDSRGGLGTLSFAVSGNNVTITSSTTKAKATCTKKDDQFLLCDWIGTDGKPSVAGRKVTYGPKRAIGGNYDTSHIFNCPPQ